MIKLYCDRCGKEIEEKQYYTINIHKEDLVNKVYTCVDYATAVSNVNSSFETDLLEKLNNTDMYCEECKKQIEACICCCNYRYL